VAELEANRKRRLVRVGTRNGRPVIVAGHFWDRMLREAGGDIEQARSWVLSGKAIES